ncbi:unnamed protein product [Arabis nemorensis]|uniref:Uncharacterized protein n=1 Tax=Arabis nemorensis TaxID=586526 RepID=A0A565BGF3_9BRAS|nr:unnamed protein product [Arabis nemorensis]
MERIMKSHTLSDANKQAYMCRNPYLQLRQEWSQISLDTLADQEVEVEKTETSEAIETKSHDLGGGLNIKDEPVEYKEETTKDEMYRFCGLISRTHFMRM